MPTCRRSCAARSSRSSIATAAIDSAPSSPFGVRRFSLHVRMTATAASPARRPSETFTEMVQVVLPNDANPLGFILGGTVMHLIDIAGAIACHRHTRSLLVTAAVDGLQFLHPIKVGDLIILRARVTAAWTTSLESEVEVFSEEILTGVRKLTSRAYLTFVAIDRDGRRLPIPGVQLD